MEEQKDNISEENFSNSIEVLNSLKENGISKLQGLESIFDYVDVLLWSVYENVNNEYFYEKVNAAFAKSMEGIADDFNGKSINEIASEEEFNQIRLSLQIAKDNGVYSYTKVIETSGRRRTILIKIIHTHLPNGSHYYICSGTDITERVKAEQELLSEQNKTKSYMDIVGVMLLIINSDQSVRQINSKGCEMLGYSEDRIVGKKWFDNFVPGGIRNEIKERFSKLMNGNEPKTHYENPILTRSGKEKIILWHSSLIHDKDGKVEGLLCSGEDITNIRKVERELVKHVRTLETIHGLSEAISLSESINDLAEKTSLVLSNKRDIIAGGFYATDNDGDLLYLLKAFGSFSDSYENEKMLRLSDIFCPNGAQQNFTISEPFAFENDGHLFTRVNIALHFQKRIIGLLRLTLTIDHDFASDFFNLAAIELGRGIQRKQAENELIETKQLLEKIAFNTPAFIFTHDLINHKILFSNKSILKSLGYNENEIKHLTNLRPPEYLHIYHKDDHNSLEQFDRNFENLKDGELNEVEYRIKDKSGNWQWFKHTAVIFSRDENGKPYQTIDILLNINEVKKAEQDAVGARQMLEKITYTSPAFISVHDIKNDRTIYSNKSILKSIGYDEEKIKEIAVTATENRLFLYHHDDINVILESDKKTLKLKDGEVLKIEFRLRDKKGNYHWFRHSTAVFQRDESGTPSHSVNVFEDITAQKKTDQLLKQKTEHLLCQQASLLELVRMEDYDLDAAFRGISKLTSKTLIADRVSIWIYSKDNTELICKNSYDSSLDSNQKGDVFVLSKIDKFFSQFDREQEVFVLKSISQGSSKFLETVIKSFGTNAILKTNIRLKGKVVGIICYEIKDPKRMWSQEEQDFAMSAASVISLALEVADRKSAEEELRIRNEQVIKQQAALLEISKLKESTIENFFKQITEITSIPLQSDRTSIWLFNQEKTEIECKDLYLPSERTHSAGRTMKSEEFNNYFGRVRSKPLKIENANIDPRSKEFTEKFLNPFGTESILMSRLRLKHEIVGIICYESKNPQKKSWTPEEYDFSLSVSGFISIALEASERLKAENEIKKSLKEKELLLKEIHHRVKNNLQVISSLLYLQSKNIRVKEQADVFLECQSRVRTMVLVHEKLYRSQDIARIDYSDYIKSLTEYLLHSFLSNDADVKININVENIFLTLDTAIHCGLIINELLSNSIKYAFRENDKGIIEVKFYAEKDNNYTLIIKDNGVGFPDNLNYRDTQTLGLQLVMILVEQLEGRIKLENQNGTKFTINFTEKITS